MSDLTSDTNVWRVDIEWLEENPNRVRCQYEDGESLSRLAGSILVYGLLSPIIAVQTSSSPVRLMIVSGHRRRKALKLLGIKEVPVHVLGRGVDGRSAALTEKVTRLPIDPLDLAAAISQMCAAENLTHAEVADRIGLCRSEVTKLIGLADLPQSVVDLVKGMVKPPSAEALKEIRSMQSSPDLQLKAARQLASKGLTRDQAREMRKTASEAPSLQKIALKVRRRIGAISGLFAELDASIGPDDHIGVLRELAAEFYALSADLERKHSVLTARRSQAALALSHVPAVGELVPA